MLACGGALLQSPLRRGLLCALSCTARIQSSAIEAAARGGPGGGHARVLAWDCVRTRSFTAGAAAFSAGAHKTAHQQPKSADAAGDRFQNPAAVLRRVNDIAFEEHPQPLPAEPPHGFVRVAMKAVGICGSDLHYVHHGRIGPFVLNEPMVLGHEGAGQIVAVGEGALAAAAVVPSQGFRLV